MRTIAIVDMPRRWRRAIVAAVVVLMFGALSFVYMAGQRGTAVDRDAEAASGGPAARRIGVALSAPQADPGEPRTTLAADSPDAGAAVCGLPAGSAPPQLGAEGQGGRGDTAWLAQLPPPTRQMFARLRTSPNELTQAAGWVLALALAEPAEAARPARVGGEALCSPVGCSDLAPTADQARDALAGLAVATRDPRVYALGLKACRHASADDGHCRQVNAAQWARLDPDNAAPWLFALATAEATGDRLAQGEALFRVAAASHNDLYTYDTAAAIVDASPDDDASLLGVWLATRAELALEASMASTEPGSLHEVCGGSALADSNRAQTCAAVADLLTDRSTTLADRRLGARLGARLGWSAARLERVRIENEAYAASLAEFEGAADVGSTVDDAGPWACATLRRQLNDILQRTEVGEIGAAREGLARRGRRVEYFVGSSRTASPQAADVAEVPPRDTAAPVADAGLAAADAATPVVRTAAER